MNDEIEVLPWRIAAGDDGLRKDSFFIGKVRYNGEVEELVSVALVVESKPFEDPR